MIRAGIGAERLGWDKNGDVLTLPSGVAISPRLTSALRKTPIMIPTTGWRGATVKIAPDWSWRVAPLRDTRADADRPKMTAPGTLFPDKPSQTANDIDSTPIDAAHPEKGGIPNFEGYQRVAERHARQMDKLRNSRQILFASSVGLVRFEKRSETDLKNSPLDVLYAIHDMYAAVPDPADLTTRPKPQLFTRHEAPLRDVWQARPDLPKPKPA